MPDLMMIIIMILLLFLILFLSLMVVMGVILIAIFGSSLVVRISISVPLVTRLLQWLRSRFMKHERLAESTINANNYECVHGS